MKKKTLTWWVGWIVLAPLRVIVFGTLFIFITIFSPTFFYAAVKAGELTNPDDWSLDFDKTN